jgi:uncharacterized RmlC-like cupin family protein
MSEKWKHDGVQIIPGHSLDPNTPQTPGMERKAAINYARVRRAEDLGRHGPHQAGRKNRRASSRRTGERDLCDSRARPHALGEHLEFTAEAGPGDFIFVPPYVPHQEINASTDDPLECVVIRSDNEAVVVNLDIAAVEKPEAVAWIDPIHK